MASGKRNFPTEENLQTAELVLCGILISFALLGIIGNILLILTYKKKDLKTRFNSLMLLLAICDLLYLIFLSFTLVVISYIGTEPVLVFLTECVFSGSVYTTTVIAFERYLVFCRDM